MKYRKKPVEVEARLHDVLYRDHGHSLPPGVQNCRACDRRIQSVMAVLRAFPRRPSQGDATEAFELLHEMNSQGRIGSDDYVALHGLVTGLGEFAPARTEPNPFNGKWICGKCAREVARGVDDGQIPEHHRTCPKRAQTEPPTIQFAARQGGKSQALIDSMLAQANERGIRVEVVYPQSEPSGVQVLAAALEINRAGWTHEGAHEPGCLADGCDECAEACLPVARSALKAAFTAGQEVQS